MAITLGVLRERATGETRVAVVPDVIKKLKALGVAVCVETQAGASCYLSDEDFGADTIALSTTQVFSTAQVLLTVQPPSLDDIKAMVPGTVLIGSLAPYASHERIEVLKARNITAFATELIPRISRAQSMDTLSSQAAVSGYLTVLIAANHCPKFFPMLTYAAGTIRPARVLVIGAGVAGLQAIATAKRLGAMVEAYDIRPAARQEIESLGAKMIDTGVNAAAEGGYARELTAEEKQKQADVLAKHIAAANAVITTAAIPGRAAPKIVTAAMVENMKRGAVIVDLAAESGGNCDLTRPGETYEHNGVVIDGPLNIPSNFPVPASEMYAKNLFNFLSPMIKDGALNLDWGDEVIAKSALTRDGQIVHEPTRKLV